MRLNKKIVLLAIIIILVALAGASFSFNRSDDQQNTKNNGDVTDQEVPEEDRPTEVKANDDGQKASPDGTTPVGQETTTPGPSDTRYLTITSASQTDSTLRVRVQAVGLTSGVCKLHLTQSDHHHVAKTAPIVLVASNYACQGFDIPVAELDHDGDWAVYVSLEDGSLETEEQTVTIQK